MAIDFPNSPSDGDLYISGDITREYSASTGTWSIVATKIIGNTGSSGIISVTAPISNTGSSTEAIIGISGTISDFNSALTGNDFATLAGVETLTNKTLTSASISSASISSATITSPSISGATITGTTTAISGTIALGTNSVAITANSASISATEIGYLDSASANIQTQINSKIDKVYTINSASSAYTLQSGDENELIELNGTFTVSIPRDNQVNFTIGTTIDLLNVGTGTITIAAVTPGTTTVNGTPGLLLRAQWSSATLIKRGTNSWVVIGDLTA